MCLTMAIVCAPKPVQRQMRSSWRLILNGGRGAERSHAELSAAPPPDSPPRHQSSDDIETATRHVRGVRTPIKIDVSPRLRGRLLLVRAPPCSKRVRGIRSKRRWAHGALHSGKIRAALNRQHPRDLFDVGLPPFAKGIAADVKKRAHRLADRA